MSTPHDRVVLNHILNPLMPSELASGDTNIEEDLVLDHLGYSDCKNEEKEGVILAEKGDVDGSIKAFTKAIELCDICPSAYNNRAQALRLSGKIEEALSDLNKAISLSGERGRSACQAFAQRALIRRLQGNDEDAKADYKKAADLGSSFAKMQLVALNPYAAMCNKMLSEVMQNLKEGKDTQ